MNEKHKETMGVFLNKLEYKIRKDDTSENDKDANEEETDDSRRENKPCVCVRDRDREREREGEGDQDEANKIFVSIIIRSQKS